MGVEWRADWEQRNLPAKGFRPGIMLLGMGAVMGYGWYKLVVGIREAKYVETESFLELPVPLVSICIIQSISKCWKNTKSCGWAKQEQSEQTGNKSIS